jgi:hypothetical protein
MFSRVSSPLRHWSLQRQHTRPRLTEAPALCTQLAIHHTRRALSALLSFLLRSRLDGVITSKQCCIRRIVVEIWY